MIPLCPWTQDSIEKRSRYAYAMQTLCCIVRKSRMPSLISRALRRTASNRASARVKRCL